MRAPNRSSLTAPPQPVGTPRVAATRATFQQAPPGMLRQLSVPVRTRSVRASPNTARRGKAAAGIAVIGQEKEGRAWGMPRPNLRGGDGHAGMAVVPGVVRPGGGAQAGSACMATCLVLLLHPRMPRPAPRLDTSGRAPTADALPVLSSRR